LGIYYPKEEVPNFLAHFELCRKQLTFAPVQKNSHDKLFKHNYN
jgi:hypothetical protein